MEAFEAIRHARVSAPNMSSNARPLAGQVALVTGASGGIGRAVTLSLSQHGAAICAVGRNASRLGETTVQAQSHSKTVPFQADLAEYHSVERLLELLNKEFGRLDILVHSTGMIRQGPMSEARIEHLDEEYATNVRMPYVVTKALLPMLKAARGQIVFINSSLGLNAKRPEVGQHAASQHALRAIAESLREEVNGDGIRLLSLYLGRTATPLQEHLYQQESQVYRPETLLQPEDVATMVISALTLPRTAEVTDISIRPMQKSY